jgi:hypothetical protein
MKLKENSVYVINTSFDIKVTFTTTKLDHDSLSLHCYFYSIKTLFWYYGSIDVEINKKQVFKKLSDNKYYHSMIKNLFQKGIQK